MRYSISLSLFVLFVSGCAVTPETTTQNAPSDSTATAPAPVDAPLGTKYPIHERLEYMARCIQQHGAKIEDTEPCACKIAKISEKLTFKDYETAITFTNLGKQAGDAGSAFRDPEQSKEFRKRLKEADKAAEEICFPKK